MSTDSIQYFVDRVSTYRIHISQGNRLIGSRGLTIAESNDGGESWRKICRLGRMPSERLVGLGKWAARLLRADIHTIVPAGDEYLTVFAGQRVMSVDSATGNVRADCALKGSRPLCVCVTDKAIYYGEYRRNPERSAVRVWASRDHGISWDSVWEFSDVRHVHGIFQDPTDDSIWITTGDDDHESIIWRTSDDFVSVEPIISDGQTSRAVTLLFSESAITFGTDIPNQRNTIRRYDRKSKQQSIVADSEGPIFFGVTFGDHAFLSTSVEPSTVNRTKDVVVYGSPDRRSWFEALRIRKDWLPPVLFQYGQARFAFGEGDGSSVWLSPLGTLHDQRSLRLTWRL